jgi:hypothetical protein
MVQEIKVPRFAAVYYRHRTVSVPTGSKLTMYGTVLYLYGTYTFYQTGTVPYPVTYQYR